MRRTCTPGVRSLSLLGAVLFAAACTERDPAGPNGTLDARPAFQAAAGAAAQARTRYIVTLAGQETSDFERRVQGFGGRIQRRHPDIATVTVTDLTAVAAAQLAVQPGVTDVVADRSIQWIPRPDQVFRQDLQPDGGRNSPPGTDQSGAQLFALQWNMQVIQAPAAWNRTPAGRGRLVCVLDSGVDPDHIELAGRIDFAKSISFVDAEPTIQDFNTHGTYTSSIVSSNGIRIASVASDGKLCMIKVLGTDGSGTFEDVIAGIVYAAFQGADVVNMSLGAYIDLREPGARQLVRVLQRAVNFARRRGVVVVASAGNDGINLDQDSPFMLSIPAQLENVISVGATAPFNQQNFDALASYSNFGGKTGISMVAPGGDFLDGGVVFDLVLGACSHTQVTLPFTCTTRSLVLAAGTSASAPHVSGAAAVVQSRLRDRAGSDRVTECLLQGADKVGPFRIFGAGRLNVVRAAVCSDREDRWDIAGSS